MRWVLAVSLGCVLALPGQALELHIAPDGDDGRDGLTPATALASLAAARDRARAAAAPTVVHVAPGAYHLEAPLTFGPEDRDLLFQVTDGGLANLLGGRAVTGFEPYRDGIMRADLRASGLAGSNFGQLFFAGRRMVLARTPDHDQEDLHGGTWAHVVEGDPANPRRSFYHGPEINPSGWRRPQEARIGVFCRFDWRWNRIRLASVDVGQRQITLAGDATYELNVGDRYLIENVFEELDQPGEWYLDREAGMLFFYPPADIASGEVTAPLVDNLVVMEGARGVRLQGFIFEACNDTAIRITDSVGCQVARSVIRNCGGWGVTIAGGEQVEINGCDIHHTGKGGVAVSGGDRATLTPSRHLVTNCLIHHVAEFDKTYNTGVNLSGVGNTVSHTRIHDTPHAGITLAGNDNLIEYCHVHHTNLQSADTGGLYSCPRDWTQRGNTIRFSKWHDLGGFGKRSSWVPVQDGAVAFEYPHYTWGIYMDDPTSGNLMYGNILYRVPICGFHNHGGRDNVVENNIIVDAPAFRAGQLAENWDNWPAIKDKFHQVCQPGSVYFTRYPALVDYDLDYPAAMTGLRYVRNICYYTAEGSAWLRGQRAAAWGGDDRMLVASTTTRPQDFATCEYDYNLFSADPSLTLFWEFQERGGTRQALDLAGWQALGADRNSMVADPRFVDPANHDYRLRPDSPALALGFQPIPVEKIGPQADPLRVTWPIVVESDAAERAKPVVRLFRLPGFEPVEAATVRVRHGLPNVLAKLQASQPVTVAYFGGGIHGPGGWRRTVREWFRTTWPNATVTEIDASMTDAVRGIGFSVYRLAHDVLNHQPDLILVDFANDDAGRAAMSLMDDVEGVVRQVWQVAPQTDLLFFYALRDQFEADWRQGLAGSAVSVHEQVAERYGIPSIDAGYAVWQQVAAGKMAFREAVDGLPVATPDGRRASSQAEAVYARTAIEGLLQIAHGSTPRPAELPRPLRRKPSVDAGLAAITPDLLSGDWRELPSDDPNRQAQRRHFDTIWYTDQPGAGLTFRFRGTHASLYWLIGPDTGRIKVTVNGQPAGERQQVDTWCYYQRIAAVDLYTGADGEHTVTVELLPTVPDRSAPIAEAQRLNQYNPAAFEGVALRIGFLRLRGELLPPGQ